MGFGAAGSAALTACQADTGGDADAGEENGADQAESGQNNPEGIFHGGNPFVAPPSGHFNMAPGVTQQLTLGIYYALIMSPGGMWDWAAEEWQFLVAEDFELTEEAFTYTVAPGLTWSDGSDLTAADVELTF